MADERKRDTGMEILGAAIFLLLIILLCHFRIICPPPSCPSGQVSCTNCPGNCCLPDGSCPCPAGSAPCSSYCPQTLNCPSGCCDINTCNCIAIPECPPYTAWSESRGCCIYLEGPLYGQCAKPCYSDKARIGGCIPGLDACDSNGCCPFGSIGWNSGKSCCVDLNDNCMHLCLVDANRSGCPSPDIGGCDSTGCCPVNTFWSDLSKCCITSTGECIEDPCARVNCPEDQICIDGNCVNDPCAGVNCPDNEICIDGNCVDPCTNVVCPEGQTCIYGFCQGGLCNGQVCPEGQICIDGLCIDLCEGLTCPSGQICRNGRCVDPCRNITCPSGQICIDGKCVNDPCAGVSCPTGHKCINGTCIDPCAGVSCPSDQICVNGECVSNLNLVDCKYGVAGACVSEDIICKKGCANEFQCVDPRLPPDQCKGIGQVCNTSSECCCGYNCQRIGDIGICCPGGDWKCYRDIDES